MLYICFSGQSGCGEKEYKLARGQGRAVHSRMPPKSDHPEMGFDDLLGRA